MRRYTLLSCQDRTFQGYGLTFDASIYVTARFMTLLTLFDPLRKP